MESEHLSRFPATTSCSLSWFLAGSAVRPGEQPVHERIVFRGPQTRPVVPGIAVRFACSSCFWPRMHFAG